jgi:hypothetical protein
VPLLGSYLAAVVAAHRIHHAGGADGSPFHFFFGPWENGVLSEKLRLRNATRSERAPRSTGRAP